MIETPNITEERIKKYLSQGKRFDGRELDEFREISIETGFAKKAEGSARVKIGKTEVIVGVKMGLGTPYPDSPDKGNLMVTVELLPLSSPRFDYGPPRFPAIELARITDRIIRESKFIQFDKLCITKGEKVWTVFVDIYSLNDDGNLLDAAGLGAVAALKNAEMPKYDSKEEKVLYGESSGKKLPLEDNAPISLTIHKVGENLFVDPTLEEQDISETRLTVGSTNEIISSMQKGNIGTLNVKEFEKVLDLAEKVTKEISLKIKKNLK